MPGSELHKLEAQRIEGTDLRDCRAAAACKRSTISALAALLFLGALAGCDVERRRSDAELGLNPQQAAGRKT